VVETSRGFQLLKVDRIEDAKVVSFDEAKNDLAVAMIREDRAPQVMKDYATKIVEAWKAEGAPPRALTEAKALPIDTTGPFSLMTDSIPRIGDAPEIEAVLATAPVGQVLPVPFVVKGTTYVVAMGSRTEPDPAAFEQQKTMMKAQLAAQKQGEYVQALRAELVARAEITRTANL
jgi:parvulin-like peptidyl-prolyl isomerase